MKRKSLMMMVLALTVPLFADAPQGGQVTKMADRLLIRAGILIDGTGGVPRVDQTIVVRGDRIEAVLPTAETKGMKGTEWDASRMTVYPGLIDVHVHLMNRPFVDPEVFAWKSESLVYEDLRALLASGITTVVSLGDYAPRLAKWKREAAEQKIPSPRILTCGLQMTTPEGARGGRWAPGGEAELEEFRQGTFLAITHVSQVGPAMRKNIQEWHPDVIKVRFYEHQEILRAIVDQAHQAHLPVWVHVGPEGGRNAGRLALEALDCGADNIQHVPIGAEEAFLNRLHATRKGWTPTLSVFTNALQSRAHYPTFLGELKSSRQWLLLAPSHREAVQGDWFQRFATSAPEQVAPIASFYPAWLNMIKRAWTQGELVTCGSDAAASDNMFGIGLINEILIFRKAGLTMAQAIACATGRAADLLGRKDLGLIAPGRLADLVIVQGDVRQDPQALFDVRITMKSGRLYSSADLLFDGQSPPGLKKPIQ